MYKGLLFYNACGVGRKFFFLSVRVDDCGNTSPASCPRRRVLFLISSGEKMEKRRVEQHKHQRLLR